MQRLHFTNSIFVCFILTGISKWQSIKMNADCKTIRDKDSPLSLRPVTWLTGKIEMFRMFRCETDRIYDFPVPIHFHFSNRRRLVSFQLTMWRKVKRDKKPKMRIDLRSPLSWVDGERETLICLIKFELLKATLSRHLWDTHNVLFPFGNCEAIWSWNGLENNLNDVEF